MQREGEGEESCLSFKFINTEISVQILVWCLKYHVGTERKILRCSPIMTRMISTRGCEKHRVFEKKT